MAYYPPTSHTRARTQSSRPKRIHTMTHTHRHRHTQPPADRPTNNETLLAMQHTTPRPLCKSTSDRGWIHRTHTETSAPKGEKDQQTPYRSGANTDTQNDKSHSATRSTCYALKKLNQIQPTNQPANSNALKYEQFHSRFAPFDRLIYIMLVIHHH